jgi:hypothetical protein
MLSGVPVATLSLRLRSVNRSESAPPLAAPATSEPGLSAAEPPMPTSTSDVPGSGQSA